jgi:hypothetical protein
MPCLLSQTMNARPFYKFDGDNVIDYGNLCITAAVIPIAANGQDIGKIM